MPAQKSRFKVLCHFAMFQTEVIRYSIAAIRDQVLLKLKIMDHGSRWLHPSDRVGDPGRVVDGIETANSNGDGKGNGNRNGNGGLK
jgi:hypothetical protein